MGVGRLSCHLVQATDERLRLAVEPLQRLGPLGQGDLALPEELDERLVGRSLFSAKLK